ncbi:hypothetical protein ACWCWD_29455 [Streptomyces sp. NPDC001493]
MTTYRRTRPPIRGRTLLGAAASLAAAGCALVLFAASDQERAHGGTGLAFPSASPALGGAGSPSRRTAAPSRAPVTESASAADSEDAPRAAPHPNPTSSEAGLPEPGAGPGADRLVQAALDNATPDDLNPTDEEQLLSLGRLVWLAEVTGTGRSRWPSYFSPQTVPPAYSRVRIQAVTARRGTGARSAAVVHLVWAGADPAGTFVEDRTATLHFTHQGETETWTPVR